MKRNLGVGTDLQLIDDWTDYIWNNYVKFGELGLTREAFDRFIQETFKEAKIKWIYDSHDVDQFFAKLDQIENGVLTQTEIKTFLFELGQIKMTNK